MNALRDTILRWTRPTGVELPRQVRTRMLDKTKALDELEMTEEEYDELLTAFVELADEQVDGLESAFSSGNDSEARELAHSLKGAAGNLRLDDCFAIASGIELALMEDRKEGFREQLDALVVALDEVRTSGAG